LAAAPSARPNFIIILTDDQGYADLGAHGIRDDVKTPHLDRLAREGAVFTDGYIAAPSGFAFAPGVAMNSSLLSAPSPLVSVRSKVLARFLAWPAFGES